MRGKEHERASPSTHPGEGKPPKPGFCFILEEKTPGVDRTKELRKIRSHSLKQYHYRRNQIKRSRVDPYALSTCASWQTMLPRAERPLALTAHGMPTMFSENFGQLQTHVQQILGLNSSGKTLGALITQDPVCSHAFDYFAQCSLDALRLGSISTYTLSIKSILLRQLQNQLIRNKPEASLFAMMLLLAGTSITNCSEGPEMILHTKAIHTLLRSQGGFTSLQSTCFARIITLHILSFRADFSWCKDLDLPTVEDCVEANLDILEIPLGRMPQLGPISETPSLRFCQNVVDNPTNASPELIVHQRGLQRKILNEVREDLLDPRSTYMSKCCQLTARILVCMAASGVCRAEDFPTKGDGAGTPGNILKESTLQLLKMLMKTELGDLWNDRVDLLWWVLAVVVPLTAGISEHRTFKALQIRLMADLASTQRLWTTSLAPIIFITKYQAACYAGFWKDVLDDEIE